MDLQAVRNKAKRLTIAQQWSEAATVWADLCHRQPDDIAPLLQLLRVKAEMGEHSQIIDLAQTARTRWPEDPKLLSRLIRSLVQLGDVDAAQPLIAELERLDPSHPTLATAQADLQTARATAKALTSDGQWPEAATAWAELCERQPGELAPVLQLLRVKAELGEHADIVKRAEKARMRWPEDPRLLSRLIRSQLHLGRITGVKGLVSELEQLDPRHPNLGKIKKDLQVALETETLLNTAKTLTRDGQWSDAATAWAELCLRQPDNATPVVQLLHVKAALADHADIAERAQKARARWPGDPDILVHLIEALLHLNAARDVQPLIAELEQLDPSHPVLAKARTDLQAALELDTLLDTAKDLTNAGQWPEAAAAWTDLCHRQPGDIAPLLQLLRVKAEMGEHAEIIDLARKAQTRWPKDPKLLSPLIRSELQLDNIAAAQTLMSELAQLDPEHPTLAKIQADLQADRNKAKDLTNTRQWSEAATVWADLCHRQPDDIAPLLQLLRVKAEMGEHSQIIDLAQTARTRWPEDPKLLSRLIRSLVQLGDVDAAQPLIAELERLDPSHPTLATAQADLQTARATAKALTSDGQWPEAATAWAELCERQPGELAPVLQLLRVKAEMGEHADIVKRAEKARMRWPEDPRLLSRLIRSQLHLGRITGVKGLVSELEQLDPRHPNLGKIKKDLQVALEIEQFGFSISRP